MSSPSEKELEVHLLNAGNSLLDPPSSDEDLLSLLDQVESCLCKVEQSPAKSMQTALSPSLRALVTHKLLEHPNTDVKVAVASCISEITRITAPDAPYDDDEMKEVFKVIVSSFKSLPDKSSRSYNKRVSILETVSKVRSCVVMLDLECDELILEMFEHFFKAIREYHSDNVFSSMETIMTLVLEESEDISQELLSPILASVKKDEEILPIARKLGERVLESSSTKVKPYLIQAVDSLAIPLKDYSQLVASICDRETSSAVEQSNECATTRQKAEDSKLEIASLDNGAQIDKEIAKEEVSTGHVDPDIEKSPKSVVSNGIPQTGEDELHLDSNSKNQEETSKKEEGDLHADQSKSTNVLSKPEDDNVTEKAECKLEQTANTRGRKSSSFISEFSDGSHAENEETLLDSHKSNSKDDVTPPCEEPSIEAAAPLDIVKDIKPSSEASVSSDIVKDTKSSVEEALPSYPVKETEVLKIESGSVASPPPTGAIPEVGSARKVGRPKKKVTSTKDTTSVADVISNKTSDATSDQAAKPAKRSGKKLVIKVSNEGARATIVTSKKESGAASDSEVKASSKASGDNEDGSSLRHPVDDKKQGHVNTLIDKDVIETSVKDDKEVVSSPKSNKKSTKIEEQLEETPQTNSKRKRTPVAEKTSGGKDGEDLVGSKIKVWWPQDKRFYEGIVDSYDSAKKKHKVIYIDGDEEVLNLEKQKWLLVASDSKSDKGKGAGESSLDASPDVPQKKKVKANSSDVSAKPGNSSSKRGRGTSSGKAKGSAVKPGRKSGANSKSKEELLKRLDDESAGKSKVLVTKSGSKSVSPSKAPNKSKNDEITPKSSTKTKQDILKTSSKSKEDTPKTANKSTGKNSKGGSKSSANGSRKVKSRSTKVKEDEDVEDPSSDSEAPLSVQLKSAAAALKAKGSGTKTGKKRQRSS